jgi:excisionase family DNA binding protein
VTASRSPLTSFFSEIERLVEAVPLEEGPALLGDLERIRARLWLRLSAASRPATTTSPELRKPDRLLSAEEAAKMLAVKPRWLYDHAHEIPGRVQLGKHVRFSERKLERWIADRSP